MQQFLLSARAAIESGHLPKKFSFSVLRPWALFRKTPVIASFEVVSSIDLCACATYEQHLKSLLTIKTDFLARTLEYMLRAIATKLPHLRSAQVLVSDDNPAPLSPHITGL